MGVYDKENIAEYNDIEGVPGRKTMTNVSMENDIENNKELVQYLIKDIIRFSLAMYGVEHTVDVDFYSSLPAEQLIGIHSQLRKDYLQSLGLQVEKQEKGVQK